MEVLSIHAPIAAACVLVSWTLLVLQRQWRCDRSWIDRAGRVLGVAWIGAGTFLGVVFLVG